MYTRLYRSGAHPAFQPFTDVNDEDSQPQTVAAYGPPRLKEKPWVRDERLDKPLDTIKETEGTEIFC
jgi:hypothetical protein